MPSPQVERVSRAGPAGLRVGEPASATTLRQWAADLQALAGMGALIGTVGTRNGSYGAAASTTRVTYRKSPWARWVTLFWQMPPRFSGSSSGGVKATFAGSQVALTSGGGDFAVATGSYVDVPLPVPSARPSVYRATFDVSGLTSGALYDFVWQTDTKQRPSWGTLVEHPLGYLYPEDAPTVDPGYAAASAQAARLIQTGGLSDPDGVGRLWALLEQLRTGTHQHYNWNTPEETASVATVSFPSYPQVIVQPRRMVAGASVVHKLRVRYKTAASPDGTLYIKQQPLSGGSPSTATVALPASTAWTTLDATWTSAATSDPRIDVRFAWDAAAVAAIAIIS